VAQAVAHAHARKERPPALGRAVEAIGEAPCDAGRRLLREGRALPHPLGLGHSCRTGLRGGAAMPEPAPTPHGRQGHCVGQTCAGLLLRQASDGQGQATPGQQGPPTLVAACTDQTGERQGRERWCITAHRATRSPPWVAKRASRATAGRLWR